KPTYISQSKANYSSRSSLERVRQDPVNAQPSLPTLITNDTISGDETHQRGCHFDKNSLRKNSQSLMKWSELSSRPEKEKSSCPEQSMDGQIDVFR
uniref:Uncharacterized protein n=1 Tax=Megaselia scalaris TaxID=36166 RepID=T1H3D2_MEGSC